MSAGGTNGAGSGSGEGVGRVKPSVGSKCAFIIALILVGAAQGGRAGASVGSTYGSSSAPKSSHTSQHHRLHEMGSSPHRSHEYWSSLFPGKMAGSNMTSYSRTCSLYSVLSLAPPPPRAWAHSRRASPFPSVSVARFSYARAGHVCKTLAPRRAMSNVLRPLVFSVV